MHGGAARQVKEAARIRLLALVDPALATMARAVRGKGKPGAVEISAAKDILDRAGIGEDGRKTGDINITINQDVRALVMQIDERLAMLSREPVVAIESGDGV
jgi:hypothetical protein